VAFKSKADQMFEAKVAHYTELRDWDALAEVFSQYGCYLQLIAPIPPVPTKELVHVPAHVVDGSDPSYAEEILYTLSGEQAKYWVEELCLDPITEERIACPPAMASDVAAARAYRKKWWLNYRDAGVYDRA
jgi:hypothetical protein